MYLIITSFYLLLTGTLALTSMSSSRVFMDADVQPSKDYLEWYVFMYSNTFFYNFCIYFNSVLFLKYLGFCLWFRLVSNSEIANRVSAEVVTKPEAVTLGELFSYIKNETSKVQ